MAKHLIKGAIEQEWREKGFILAGVDEVGRGCIAGPVVAAAVVLDYVKLHSLNTLTRAKIRDSKTLSAKQRAELVDLIQEISTAHAIGHASAREIESIGILKATFLAMNRAIASLKPFHPTLLLVDGNQNIAGQDIRQIPIVKGDSLCFSIAAASILAKEFRDHLMQDQAQQYPLWGFERHVGYGTAEHIKAINEHGICELHRRNFAPIRDLNTLDSINFQ
jgi:ribonuclease HII